MALVHDFRYGLRSLRRSWPATLVAIGSLGAAIGANATVFGTLHAVYTRRLPLPNPRELVAIQAVRNGRIALLTYSDARRLGQLAPGERMAMYRSEPAAVGAGIGGEESVWIDAVSGEYFATLGAAPRMGRVLTPDDASGGAQVAVISDAIWRRQFGADSNVLGRSILIDRQPFVIVGVMPRAFGGVYFAHAFTLAIPITASGAIGVPDFRNRSVSIVARVGEGAERRLAAARLDRAFLQCCRVAASLGWTGSVSAAAPRHGPLPEDPPLTRVGTVVDSIAGPHLAMADASRGLAWSNDLRAQYARVMMFIALGATLLLIIACANVATLYATQSAARRREFATRIAIGAGRARLARQLFVQGLELSFGAVVVGVLIGIAGMGMLARNLPDSAKSLVEVLHWRPDLAFLGYSVAVCVACTLACAAWPARLAGVGDIVASLRSDDHSTWRASRMAPVRALVAAQIGLGLVLVAAALLFATSLRSLAGPNGGFGARDLVLAELTLDARGGGSAGGESGRLRARLQLLESMVQEGAGGRALAATAPLLHNARMMLPMTIPGGGSPEPALVDVNAVSAGFFDASGIRLEQGRAFGPEDDALSEPVAIVSRAFARRYVGMPNVVGRTLMLTPMSNRPVRIVGVARDAQYGDIHDPPTEMVYLPLSQTEQSGMAALGRSLVLLAGAGAESSPRALQERLAAAGVGATVRRVVGVRALLDQALARERLANFLATIFGVVAAALVALGTYGVIAFSVVQRTHEIGIRTALGATPGHIRRLFFRQTAVMLGAGLAVGVPGAMLAIRAMLNMIYGIRPMPLAVIVGSTVALAMLAVAATVLPVLRATRLPPTAALRAD